MVVKFDMFRMTQVVTKIDKSIPALLYTSLASRLIEGGDVSLGYGLLSMDANRKIICILPNDPSVKSAALTGVWIDLTDEMFELDRLICDDSPLSHALSEYTDLRSRLSDEKIIPTTLCLVFHRDPRCPSVIVSEYHPHSLFISASQLLRSS
jgi:hypothetical protein